jgi:hypothetical protein
VRGRVGRVGEWATRPMPYAEWLNESTSLAAAQGKAAT